MITNIFQWLVNFHYLIHKWQSQCLVQDAEVNRKVRNKNDYVMTSELNERKICNICTHSAKTLCGVALFAEPNKQTNK